MSVLQDLIVKFNNKKNPQLYIKIIKEIQSAENIWTAFSPASNNYYLGNENGKAAAYIFSEKNFFDVFYVHENQKGYELKAAENPVQYRMALFADLYRSGFQIVVIDNGQTYLKLDLFDIIKKPEVNTETKKIETITNQSLVRIADWFLQESSKCPAPPQMWRMMFDEILAAEYIVPTETKNLKIKENKFGKIKLGRHSQVAFPVLKNEQGKSFFPFFTDYNEFRKFDIESKYMPLLADFNDIERFTDADGIVVNPFGMNFILTKEMLEEIRKISLEEKNG